MRQTLSVIFLAVVFTLGLNATAQEPYHIFDFKPAAVIS